MAGLSEERLAPSNGIEIAYQEVGDPAAEPLLLVMGLGTQMLGWDEELCELLAGRGFRVVRFDNRDIGRSTMLDEAGVPSRSDLFLGRRARAAYLLPDMAADAVGLMDHLGIESAHVVGASMGGMIGQTIAIEHPTRLRSLTTMMSTTGDRSVGQMHPATMKALFGGPPARTREEVVARAVRGYPVMGSPAFPADLAAVAEVAGLAYDRDHDDVGIARQAVASVTSGDRTKLLRSVDVPTLVLHGLADTLCDPSGGRATAAAIPGAELVLIDGMGHNLPPGLWERIADHIAAVVRKGLDKP